MFLLVFLTFICFFFFFFFRSSVAGIFILFSYIVFSLGLQLYQSCNQWVLFIVSFIFLGGVMVLFVYVNSLGSNKLKFSFFFALFFIVGSFFLYLMPKDKFGLRFQTLESLSFSFWFNAEVYFYFFLVFLVFMVFFINQFLSALTSGPLNSTL